MQVKPFKILDPLRYVISMMRVHWQKFLLLEILFSIPLMIFYRATGLAQNLTGSLVVSSEFNPLATAVSPWIVVGILAVLFISVLWLPAAYGRLSLLMYDHKPMNMQQLIGSSLRYTPSLLGALLLLGSAVGLLVAMTGCMCLGSMNTVYFVPAVISALLLLLGCLYFCVRVSLYQFFIVDKGYGPLSALQSSYSVTRNVFWLMLAVQITLCMVVGLAGAMVRGLASLLPLSVMGIVYGVLFPISGLLLRAPQWLAYVYMYKKLTGEGEVKGATSFF